MNKLRLLILLLCFGFNVNAQSYYTITGIVLDAETGQPMQGASVFAENTTKGTLSDESGTFKLWLPNGGHNLTVTYTGYVTNTQQTTNNDEDKHYRFVMKRVVADLTDVVVVSSNEVKDGWEKYGQFFSEYFLGRSPIAKECKVLNPEVLKFYFSKRKNRLKVVSEQPILISNPVLGYNIYYSLDSFTYEYASNTAYYTGNQFFQDLYEDKAVIPVAVEESRENAYRGSVLHFMRSLYHQKLKEEGFEIQFLVQNNETEEALKLKDFYTALRYSKDAQNNIVKILPRQTEVAVLYLEDEPDEEYITWSNDTTGRDFQFSVLSFLKDTELTIEQNGYFYDQSTLSFKEYWTYENVGDMVPYDYGIQVDYTPVMEEMMKNIFKVPVPKEEE